ncbi:MAG: hypothetical protein AABX53_02310 [Nanoarchaeota archaeon]
MDEEETVRLTKKDAARKGLIHLLSLGKGRKKFLADIEHPRGGTIIAEVYQVIDQNRTRYTLTPPTRKDKEKLIKKYEEGTGNGFTSYKNQRR